MKKRFLFLITFLFLLSGCSQGEPNEINVNSPYEIKKGTSTLSYYDSEDNIRIDGFNVVENNLQNFQDKNNNIIVNGDGTIRCITVVDDTVKTFQLISVGDRIEKIGESFDNEYRNGNNFMVLFADNVEEDPTSQSKEDTWIWITYYTDGSKIISIQIYDVKYGTELQ